MSELDNIVGLIVEIETPNEEKNYTTLVITNAIPWVTKFRHFCVWAEKKLYYKNNDKALCKKGDFVCVNYRKARFDRLISI